MEALQVRLVAEEVVEDEDVSNPSEASNDYNRLPDLNNIQQAMNIILEKSEDSMNEGDYLEVANKLKSFYTDVKKLESLVKESVPLYIKQDVIVENHLDYYKDISFRLSRDELRRLMNGRIRERDIRMIDRIKENIVVCYRELNDIQRNKKFYWDGIKSLPNRGSIKDNMRIQHKNFVEAEKNMIESIRRQREHMHILEARVGYVV
uniref:Uncharacterized protein n=1 Tax=viral metagenome TaxID=1070528 RepID=A0A6C0E3Z3_9ZZZZ